MSDHSDTIRSVSQGDHFHFYDPSQENWIDSAIEEVDKYRSSYRADRVVFSDEAIDGSRLRGSMSKSNFKKKIRDGDKKIHTGESAACRICQGMNQE